MSLMELPVFPLNTVLFPGGVLPLRIFEPRYLDMVSECLKSSGNFAVMRIQEGQEAGQAADFYSLGTLAQIVDFDQHDDGLLGITCRGGERVRSHSHQVRDDNLIVAQIEFLPAEPTLPLSPVFEGLAAFLKNVLDNEEAQSYRQWLEEDWDSTTWIGFRLAELLPLPIDAKQELLEMRDASERLTLLQEILRDNDLL